jgi:hypothetical protein
MTSCPWITFQGSPGGGTGASLTHYEPSLSVNVIQESSKPSFVTVFGKRLKTTMLEHMLGNGETLSVHKEVYLRTAARLRSGSTPLVFIDSGVHSAHLCTLSMPLLPSTTWRMPHTRDISATLCSNLFVTFSSVVCCFVSDLGGPNAVAQWLATQALAPLISDRLVAPLLLLVFETTSNNFDESIAATRAKALLLNAVQKLTDVSDVRDHAEERKKVVLLRELHRAIIYTTR